MQQDLKSRLGQTKVAITREFTPEGRKAIESFVVTGHDKLISGNQNDPDVSRAEELILAVASFDSKYAQKLANMLYHVERPSYGLGPMDGSILFAHWKD